MSGYTFIPLILGLVGLGVAFYIYKLVLQYSEGEDKIKKIADQIHLGAMVFMKSEYRILAIFAVILFVLLLLWLCLLNLCSLLTIVMPEGRIF